MGVQGLEVFRVQGLGFERGLGFRVCFFCLVSGSKAERRKVLSI